MKKILSGIRRRFRSTALFRKPISKSVATKAQIKIQSLRKKQLILTFEQFRERLNKNNGGQIDEGHLWFWWKKYYPVELKQK